MPGIKGRESVILEFTRLGLSHLRCVLIHFRNEISHLGQTTSHLDIDSVIYAWNQFNRHWVSHLRHIIFHSDLD